MRYFVLAAALIFVAGCTPPETEPTAPEPAADATVSDPENYHLLFENEDVRVLHVIYEPGHTSNLHRHPNLEAVVLKDAHFLFTALDGTETEVDLPAGTPLYSEAEAHTVSNVGETAGEVILVELKDDEGADEDDGEEGDEDDDVAMDPALDSTVADAERHTVVFENDLIRVIRFDYAAGAESNMHSHPEGVVIPLASGSALVTLGDGTEIEAELNAGEPYWTDAVVHKALNRSDSNIHGFAVEVKD